VKRLAFLPVVLATALPCFPAAAPARDPGAAEVRARVRAYRAAHEAAILDELTGLLAVPNMASDSPNIEKNAERISAALVRRGVRAELLRVSGAPPVVYGELPAPGAARTMILYAHYDGQRVVPSQWAGDPWKPVLRDKPLDEGGREIPFPAGRLDPESRLYARSASDDKAPIVALLAALDALKAGGFSLPANLKFFFEGEEEAGSPHLETILKTYADRLRGDLWLLFDGPVHQSRRMQIYFGARGVTEVELTTYGALRRLHSGHYGNWSPNPIVELARLVAGMRDTSGRITIPGFADDVRPLAASERRAVAAVPDTDDDLKRELALARTEGGEEKLVEAILRPALNLRGFSGGEVGSRTTNSIPTEATLSIDFRLVPDQTPAGVRKRFERYLEGQGYFLVAEAPDRAARLAHPRIARLRWGSGYPAYRTSMDLPVSRAVARVVEEAAGAPLIELPSLGGSIPMYLFAGESGTPVIGIPIVNHDNNQHAANENLRLQNFWDGIEVCASLIVRLGSVWR
jgi:acetylornithine deacetylase/succinyl-diaminopimelate desuccinylase-like protein